MPEQHNPVVVSEHELSEIRALIERRSGIHFDESRHRFLSTRVREHVAAKKLAHGADLLRLMRNSNVEYDALLERLLTQETSFFRYPDVFDVLEKKVIPDLRLKKFWENPRNLRIWSAGCATGEEPYSIAITLAEAMEVPEAWNIHILATDVSRQALQQAEAASYGRRALQNVSPAQLQAYFTRNGDRHTVKERIRKLVSFAPLNLAQAVYMGRFDCIFCMNVLIYFSEARRNALIQRFHEYLEPGGYLFLGHAETVAGAPVKFQTIIHRECRVFQKPAERGVRAMAAGGEDTL